MTLLLPILAVLISFGLIWVYKPERALFIRLLLALSGAFLLGITVFDLLPEVYENTPVNVAGICIIAGILLQTVLEFFSKGAEHGHVHITGKLQGLPWVIFASLSFHSFLEGIPLTEGAPILYGVVVHKIPVALILSLFLLQAQIKWTYALLAMIIFAIMTPLGTITAGSWDFLLEYASPATAVLIGIFLHVSTVILYESTEGHTFNFRKIMAIILGFGLAFFI